jgi:uncharacterized protein YcnI
MLDHLPPLWTVIIMMTVQSPSKTTLRAVLVVLLVAAVLVLTALPGSAHVRVTPTSTTAGGYSLLTFQVPNERDLPTTELTVTMPEGLTYAAYEPVPGWSAEVTKDDDEVESLTWSATGAGIEPGQLQRFALQVGPLPEGQLTFPTLQTYSDGFVSRWIEETEDGQAEPENPAPFFEAVPGTGGTDAHGHAQEGGTSEEAAGAEDHHESSSTSGIDVTFGLALLAVGLSLVALGLALRKRR